MPKSLIWGMKPPDRALAEEVKAIDGRNISQKRQRLGVTKKKRRMKMMGFAALEGSTGLTCSRLIGTVSRSSGRK